MVSLVARPWKKLAETVGAIDNGADDAELHDIRIHTKRCRYAAEAVAPILGKRARRFAESATALQDVLGEHQDAVVAARWLRRKGIESGGAFAYVAGELASAERDVAARARAQWPHDWKSLIKAADRLGL